MTLSSAVVYHETYWPQAMEETHTHHHWGKKTDIFTEQLQHQWMHRWMLQDPSNHRLRINGKEGMHFCGKQTSLWRSILPSQQSYIKNGLNLGSSTFWDCWLSTHHTSENKRCIHVCIHIYNMSVCTCVYINRHKAPSILFSYIYKLIIILKKYIPDSIIWRCAKWYQGRWP